MLSQIATNPLDAALLAGALTALVVLALLALTTGPRTSDDRVTRCPDCNGHCGCPEGGDR